MLNEFRQDLVSGEWVLFATGRAQRHGDKPETAAVTQSKENCPFEDPEKSGQEVLATFDNKDGSGWLFKAIKNKFPAVLEGKMAQGKQIGPFNSFEGRGNHEVIIFRDHNKDLSRFSAEEMAVMLGAYQERYSSMLDHGSMKYVLIFHNKGPWAGATISHPHSQVMAIPILPPDVKRSIDGSERFYLEHNKRVYDIMIQWEVREKNRIVYENDYFIAFCPFVSRVPYEVRIFPKESHAHFDQMSKALLPSLADVLGVSLQKIASVLNNPDYNFFIHTSPLESSHAHEFYTWHLEIIPKTSITGGFELGSGIDVNVIDPDAAAEELRNAHI